MKECLQLEVDKPTPCFVKAGNMPCVTEGCTVKDRINELSSWDIDPPNDFAELLLHSQCRMSALSEENDEFIERISSLNLQT